MTPMQRVAALGLALTTLGALAADAPLTVAQVEQVTGVKGLHTAPGKYDKNAVNFVDGSNTTIATVKLQSAEVYDVWKRTAGPVQEVPNLGSAAFLSQSGVPFVCFKKASRGVCVVPGLGQPKLTQAQILELARLGAAAID